MPKKMRARRNRPTQRRVAMMKTQSEGKHDGCATERAPRWIVAASKPYGLYAQAIAAGKNRARSSPKSGATSLIVNPKMPKSGMANSACRHGRPSIQRAKHAANQRPNTWTDCTSSTQDHFIGAKWYTMEANATTAINAISARTESGTMALSRNAAARRARAAAAKRIRRVRRDIQWFSKHRCGRREQQRRIAFAKCDHPRL